MRRWIMLLAAVAMVACGGDSTSPTSSIAGTWTLKTINGSGLPFIIVQSGTTKLELISDVITITANSVSNGAFTQLTTIRTTQNGQVTAESVPDAGTYTLTGTAVTFHFNSDGSTGSGSWSGNTITATEEGFAAVYQR